MPSKQKKILAAESHIKLAENMLADDPVINQARFWHDSLTLDNIYVDDQGRILGILDWRFTELTPLYAHRIEPQFLESEVLIRKPFLLTLPQAKEVRKMHKMLRDPDLTKRRLDFYYLRQHVVHKFRTWMKEECEPLYKALEFQDSKRYDFLRLAQNLLVEGETLYKNSLATQVRRGWRNAREPDYNLSEPPFKISKKPGRTPIKTDTHNYSYAIQYMVNVKQGVGEQFLKDSGFIVDLEFRRVRGMLSAEERKHVRHPRATIADLVIHPTRRVGERYVQDSGLVKHEDFDAVKEALGDQKTRLAKKFGKKLSPEDMEAAWPFDN